MLLQNLEFVIGHRELREETGRLPRYTRQIPRYTRQTQCRRTKPKIFASWEAWGRRNGELARTERKERKIQKREGRKGIERKDKRIVWRRGGGGSSGGFIEFASSLIYIY